MPLTDEEKNEIINLAVEKALLMLPEVVGTMMKQHATMNKLNSKFYSDYPEFVNHKQAVASVLEKVDADHPFMKYEDLLALAVPEIRERIALVTRLDTINATSNPNRDFSDVIEVDPNSKYGAL